MAVGLRSGGEGVATALQLYCDSPQLDDHAVIVALDYSNAYSTSLLDSAARATLMLIEWVEQLDEATRTRLAIKDVSEVVKAAEATLDDLAFLRTHHGEVLTVVDGHLERFAVLLGFTQGGLFSMVCFCIAVCFLVLKPLKEEFSEIAPKCIADDAHVPTVIREVPHIQRLARWCHRYVTLSIRELHLSANARKFKILQSHRGGRTRSSTWRAKSDSSRRRCTRACASIRRWCAARSRSTASAWASTRRRAPKSSWRR